MSKCIHLSYGLTICIAHVDDIISLELQPFSIRQGFVYVTKERKLLTH